MDPKKLETFMCMIQEKNEHVVYIENMLRSDPWLAQCHEPLLKVACDGNERDVVHLLLKYKAYPNTSMNFNPLLYAIFHGCKKEICTLLLDYGAEPNQPLPSSDVYGLTHPTIFQVIEQKAFTMSSDVYDAARIVHETYPILRELQALHDIGAFDEGEEGMICRDMFSKLSDEKKSMWLIQFVADKNLVYVDVLLSMMQGPELNLRTYFDSETALEIACMKSHGVLAHKLLSSKADPNTSNHKGETVLSLAFHIQSLDICKLLLEHGAIDMDLHSKALAMAFEEKLEWPLEYLVMSKEVELQHYAQQFKRIDTLMNSIGMCKEDIVHNLEKEYIDSKVEIDDTPEYLAY